MRSFLLYVMKYTSSQNVPTACKAKQQISCRAKHVSVSMHRNTVVCEHLMIRRQRPTRYQCLLTKHRVIFGVTWDVEKCLSVGDAR